MGKLTLEEARNNPEFASAFAAIDRAEADAPFYILPPVGDDTNSKQALTEPVKPEPVVAPSEEQIQGTKPEKRVRRPRGRKPKEGEDSVVDASVVENKGNVIRKQILLSSSTIAKANIIRSEYLKQGRDISFSALVSKLIEEEYDNLTHPEK